MQKHYGKLDTALAEAYLSDHYDSYEKKVDIGKRSLCGHEEFSAEGEPVWGNPPFARLSGAVTGKVMDANMAERTSASSPAPATPAAKTLSPPHSLLRTRTSPGRSPSCTT